MTDLLNDQEINEQYWNKPIKQTIELPVMGFLVRSSDVNQWISYLLIKNWID